MEPPRANYFLVIFHNFFGLVLAFVAQGGRLADLDKIFSRAHPRTYNLGYFQDLRNKELDIAPRIEYNFTHGDKNYI